jgi:cell division protein FtsQ
VAVPLLVGLAAWVLLGSGWLEVRSVEVVGVERVTDRLVVLTADVPAGTPLARVDLGDVEKRVEGIDGVADATVSRGWPHTLRIVVSERVAVAVVAEPDGSWRLIDADGRAFGAAPAPPPGAVRVAGEPGRELADDQLRAAAAVAASLPDDLAGQVAAVEPASADDVRLVLAGGAEVRWGSAAEPAAKAAILRVLLQRPAQVYDVSTPRTPTTS